uniref:Uncharacterized protein n=1 Tax=Oryza sativa subsp. japonica TaxID=39947 RepID=Q2R1D7_ORYSJ|nr:hypothetical protein LOC_Os11g39520 [Oryza sativa Japonica Group]
MADGLTKYYLCCNIYASRLALCYNDLVHFRNRGSMSNVSFSKRCKDSSTTRYHVDPTDPRKNVNLAAAAIVQLHAHKDTSHLGADVTIR